MRQGYPLLYSEQNLKKTCSKERKNAWKTRHESLPAVPAQSQFHCPVSQGKAELLKTF
jgi:hypothetical protein